MSNFEFPKFLTQKELSDALSKDSKEIDYDDLLHRAGSQDAMRRVYRVAEYELRHMAGGEEKWRQSINEFFATHDPDGDGVWWMVMRLNELMGSPLKLKPLPEWDKAPAG